MSSVECRGKIFYCFGCQLENHRVECRLGMITIFHAANKTSVPSVFTSKGSASFQVGVECRDEF